MMKVVCLVLALFAALVACEDPIKVAGNTIGTAAPQTLIPVVDDDGSCTKTDFPVPYFIFSAAFATAGVREIVAIGAPEDPTNVNNTFATDFIILIYTAYPNSSDPCTNLLGPWISRNTANPSQTQFDGRPTIDWFVNFNAGTYYIVVTSQNLNGNGYVAVNILPGDATGTITSSSPTWLSLTFGGSATTCEQGQGSAPIPYGFYTWTQATSGNFDISVFFSNTVYQDDLNTQTTLALFRGSGTPATSIQDPCNLGVSLTFVAGVAIQNEQKVTYYATLTAGQAYTVLFDAQGDTSFQSWGVRVTPSALVSFAPTATTNFAQPNFGTGAHENTTTACTPDPTATDTSYYTDTITATNSVYLVLAGQYPGFGNSTTQWTYPGPGLRWFVYGGLNTATPPVACPTNVPVLAYTQASPIWFLATSGNQYSIVTSTAEPFPATVTGPGPFSLVLTVLTGTAPTVVMPTSTTTTGTTGATSTGTVSTATTASGTIGSTSTTGSQAALTTTNGAASFGASAVVALVVLFGLLL